MKCWMLYQGNWTFWLDFQYLGTSEMETGVAVCDAEQMATCATLGGSFEMQVHLFHKGKVLSYKKWS